MANFNDFNEELTTGINFLMKIIEEYKNKNNIEIEIRIGQIQYDGFNSGLGNKEFYDKIKSKLDSSKVWSKILNIKTEEVCKMELEELIDLMEKKFQNMNILKNKNILLKIYNIVVHPMI